MTKMMFACKNRDLQFLCTWIQVRPFLKCKIQICSMMRELHYLGHLLVSNFTGQAKNTTTKKSPQAAEQLMSISFYWLSSQESESEDQQLARAKTTIEIPTEMEVAPNIYAAYTLLTLLTLLTWFALFTLLTL